MSAGPIQFIFAKNYPNNYTLYKVAGASSAQACYLYYFAKIQAPQGISFADSLKTPGIYIFSNSPQLENIQDLLAKLDNPTAGFSIFWTSVNDGNLTVLARLQVPTPDKNPPQGQAKGTLSGINFNFANFQLQYIKESPLTSPATMVIDSNSQAAMITLPTGGSLALSSNGAGQSLSITNNNTLTIPFSISPTAAGPTDYPATGAQPGGTLGFAAQSWTISTLYTIINGSDDSIWGGAIRYYYKDTAGKRQQLTFPVFGPARLNQPDVADFLVQLDWFNPTYPAQTFIRPSNPAQAPGIFQWDQANAMTVAGDALALKATNTVGFYLTMGDSGRYYLSPYGNFTLKLLEGQDKAKLMPGLSALEFMLISENAVLQLVPNQPAFSQAFNGVSVPTDDSPNLLDETMLTSWVRLLPASGTVWSYFSQPAAMSFYGVSDGGSDYNLADVLEVKIGDYPQAANPAAPLALYYNFLQTYFSPNPNPMVAVASAFDRQILATVRFANMLAATDPSMGPILYNNQTQLYTKSNALSSNGFIFDINSAGANAGKPSALTLAVSGADRLRIKANSQGILDPQLSGAMMNNQGFVVINAWDKLSLDNKISISGFTFNVSPITTGGQTINPIMVFKTGQDYTLTQFINNPQTWANTGNLLEDKVKVQQALHDALEQANTSASSDDDPFQNFRQIANTPDWTGVLVFNCPIDGSKMDPDFQMLFAGIDGALVAHHFGIETNQTELVNNAFVIATSSLFGVINYQNQETSVGTDLYAFTVKELVIVFNNSTITAFHATVGLTINQIFGRDVYLQGGDPEGIPNTLYIQGQYQTIGGVGRVSFNSDTPFPYAFNPDATLVRALDQYVVTGASLAPTGNEQQPGGQQVVKSRFILNAQLFFSNPLVSGQEGLPDLLSYGAVNKQNQPIGLPLTGTAFNIQVTLDADGQAVPNSQQVTIDVGNWAVQENKAAVRPNSVVAAMPFKLSSLLQANTDGAALDAKTLGQSVTLQQLVGNVCTSPHYALKFELPLGSLGALSDAYASIDSSMIMAWGPSDTTPDNDGVSVYIQLPEVSGGLLGFNLEGILKTVFGDANLMQVNLTNPDQTVYALLFNNVAISILGVKLPPKVIVNFVVFADPAQGGSNLAWSLATGQTPSSKAALIEEPTN